MRCFSAALRLPAVISVETLLQRFSKRFPRTTYRNDSKNSYDPTSFNFTVTGGSSHRSLMSAENALNADSSVSGFPPSLIESTRCERSSRRRRA